MNVTLLASVVLGVLMAWTTPLYASCDSVASAVAEQCGCDGDASGPWRNHGVYVSCVQKALSGVTRAGERGGRCRQQAFRCAAGSICGRAGSVVCVHRGKCRLTASAERCVAKGGTVSPAQSCCG